MDWTKPSAEEVTRFEAALPADPRVKRVKMFGLPHGKVGEYMFAGRNGRGITLRLPEREREELLRQGASIFEPMPGRPMKDWVLLPPAMLKEAGLPEKWMRRAFEYALALPPKAKKKSKRALARPR